MIELKKIFKTYHMGDVPVKALRDVSVNIAAGEFVAIVGSSGSGKSTLMHVMGLLDRPDTGRYALNGRDVSTISDEELACTRNHMIGFVFQQFHLLPRMSALANTGLPQIYAGMRGQAHAAKHALEAVGLADRMLHRPAQLSGGQQQRVAIARALVNNPPLIMADEPTGNLDSKSRGEIVAILQELNHQGKTVVIVTHEKEVAAYARRVIRIADGEIVSDECAGVCVPVDAQHVFIDQAAPGNTACRPNGMKIFEYFRQASQAVFAHKTRAFLSVLGILIGIAAVIAMLSLGEGAKASIEKQLASLGSNLLVVRPGSARIHGVALGAGAVTRFTLQDVEAIAKLKGQVRAVSPSVQGKGQLVYGNKNWSTQVEGVGTEYGSMRASLPDVGRFFNAEDMRTRAKVALVGLTVARELFGEENPVGSIIKINLNNFKIIGVLPAKGANSFHDQDDVVLVPVTTGMYRLFGKQYVDTIYAEAVSPQALDEAQDAITRLIRARHRIRKDNQDSFQIRNMSDIKKTLETTTQTMSMLLGGIAFISLAVGGIGIMNIMLVSVTERTREIGLRKAIGAANRDILAQFLIEAVLLCCVGGLLGIALGSGIAVLITTIAGWSVRVSFFSVALATAFSLAVGLVFGLWPARQAAQLNPIEALRYE